MTSQYGEYVLHAGLARLYACMRKHAQTDQYVILIFFPQQQWFHERTSMLCYMYIACLVFCKLLHIRMEGVVTSGRICSASVTRITQ
jgi:hypothetical protein